MVWSERLKSIENPFKEPEIPAVVVSNTCAAIAVEKAFGHHVAHNHADHSQRELEMCGHFGNRRRLCAQKTDLTTFSSEAVARHSAALTEANNRLERYVGR